MKKVTEKDDKVKTNTYNYPPDSHEEFCIRCLKYHNWICPDTGKTRTSSHCNI